MTPSDLLCDWPEDVPRFAVPPEAFRATEPEMPPSPADAECTGRQAPAEAAGGQHAQERSR